MNLRCHSDGFEENSFRNPSQKNRELPGILNVEKVGLFFCFLYFIDYH